MAALAAARADRALLLEHVLSISSARIVWPPEDFTATRATRIDGHPVDLSKVSYRLPPYRPAVIRLPRRPLA
eukprot:COSAG05_NODE_3136_length_2294_cov_41.168826_2_plen_72_part_00